MIHDVSDDLRAEIQLITIFLIDAERGRLLIDDGKSKIVGTLLLRNEMIAEHGDIGHDDLENQWPTL